MEYYAEVFLSEEIKQFCFINGNQTIVEWYFRKQ